MAYTPNNPYIPGDPYSYDLKWIISELKKAIELYTPLHDEFENLSDQVNSALDYINTYFANLDLTDEVRTIINNLINDGTMYELIYNVIQNDFDVPSMVSTWLDDNITPGAMAVVDSSLSISGAGADAAITGGILGGIKSVKTVDGNYVYSVVGTTIQRQDSANWFTIEIPIKTGMAVYVAGNDYGTTYIPIIELNSSGNVSNTVKFATTNDNTPYKLKYTATVDGTLIVSSRTSAPLVLNNQFWREIGYINSRLKIGCINCGAFEHPSYLQKEWKYFVNDSECDVLGFEDATANPDYIDDITALRYPYKVYRNQGMYLTARYLKPIRTINLLLTDNVGTLVNNVRNKGIIGEFPIGNENSIYIGIFHLAPSTGYEALRAAQYQDIITACSAYEKVILMGDFNAQSDSEYDIFRNNGYSIANGDLLPSFATLRDIPADNIIYKGIILDNLQMINTQNITDHNALTATAILN